MVIAMAIAGTINASMLIMAAALFNASGLTGVGDIDKAFEQLNVQVGSTAVLFGVALLASGFSSSSVGTMSGQVVMQGFINRSIPLWLRRFITMLPALVILAVGLNPSRSLVISQVVLSFGIPFALIPLLIHCRNRQVMGALVNRRATTAIATVVVALIVSLNVFLLYQTFFGSRAGARCVDSVGVQPSDLPLAGVGLKLQQSLLSATPRASRAAHKDGCILPPA